MKMKNASEDGEDNVSVVDLSTHGGSSHKQNDSSSHLSSDNPSNFEIATKESKQVFYQKLLVISVLFLAAVCVCVAVYLITSRAEEDEFEQHFKGGAEKIVSSFEAIIQEKIGSVGSLCLAYTALGKNLATTNGETVSAANNKGHSWPFVTMDSFHERAASTRILSNVLHMSLMPIVTEENRKAWEEYSVQNSEWFEEGFAYQQALLENGFSLGYEEVDQDSNNDMTRVRLLEEYKAGITPFKDRDPRRRRSLQDEQTNNTTSHEDEYEDFDLFIPKIYEYTPYWEIGYPPANATPFAPVWQSSPVTSLDGINLNVRSFDSGRQRVDVVIATGDLALRGFMTSPPGNTSSSDFNTAWYAEMLSTNAGESVYYSGDPLSEATYPIFSDFEGKREVIAAMNFQFSWQTYFSNILPDNARGFVMVLENACDGAYTYRVDGAVVEMLGIGDLHDPSFDGKNMSTYLEDGLVIHDGSKQGVKLNQMDCPYSLHVYPSQQMYDKYNTNMPLIITVCILFIFVFTAFMFVIYDRLVNNRHQVVVSTAKQSTDIVSSLFPEGFRDRILQQNQSDFLSPNQRLKSYLKGGTEDSEKVKPIADLFPHTTVCFADICGFTAWSSTRDPSQVFLLLQTVYGEFDIIARRRHVFKVETIGDSYVSVAGLPNPEPNHAVIMTRFAWECKKRLLTVLHELEVALGPDTAELGMRFGLHSGAVTAGVLRGERARFQLFGDTVNTAARMESTGKRNMVQVSHSTANLLVAAGKGHWLESRDDAVLAKGKGVLMTFWAFPERLEEEAVRKEIPKLTSTQRNTNETILKEKKQDRLVQWMTDMLLDRLRQIVVRRMTLQGGELKDHGGKSALVYKPKECPLEEVVEAIKLPDFDYNAVSAEDPASVKIPEKVKLQLRDHVEAIASRYNNNPFHNFEHACHVTMSVSKLLGRVVAPEIDLEAIKGKDARGAVMSHIHDYTHGINSDPVTLFAIVYSALIHDLDHQGISNVQLMKEDPAMAQKYQQKSVAEQNSLDLAWELLMVDETADLRAYLFGNDKSDLLRFRQVIVNIVLATDIFDKELNDLRKTRWSKAFNESAGGSNDSLRATIVLEHIIQASDVSHTMQHWHIYRKWNRRLFLELYAAFKQGRMGADPTSFWFNGEIGFFDNYIIPLAKKLKDCGVFGVSSDEYLTYAMQNRAEWEARGESILKELIQEAEAMYPSSPHLEKDTSKHTTNPVKEEVKEASEIDV